MNMKDRVDQLLSKTADMALNRRARWIIQNINFDKKLKILDVGCGDGFYIHIVSKLGQKIEIIGVDTDDNALRSARKNLPKLKSIKLIKASILRLPLESESFDIVIISEVLEHLDSDLLGLKEVRRVLKRDGMVLISVPNLNFPFLWDPVNFILQNYFGTHIKSGFWAGIWNQHQRLYKKDQLVRILKKTRFKNIETEIQTKYCLPFNHYFINLGARFLAKGSTKEKKEFSKFSMNDNFSLSSLVFYPFFLIDKLNKIYSTKHTGVSLVAKAVK